MKDKKNKKYKTERRARPETGEKDPILFTETSQTHRTYLIIYGTVGICLFGYIIMTIRYVINSGAIPWLDVMTEFIVLCALLAVSMTRSSYEIHKKDIVITCSSPIRTRTLRIPYKAIDGVHHFKVEPIKSIAYKHSYRMYGSMDRRPIWTLVYNLPNTDKVARVFLKASEEFWHELEKLMPGRVRVGQDEVLSRAFRHISGVDLNKPLEDVGDEPQKLDAEIELDAVGTVKEKESPAKDLKEDASLADIREALADEAPKDTEEKKKE